MPILKEEYLSIPDSVFASKDIDMIFNYYSNEFLGEKDTVGEFLAMFLNIIRDFLAHKIDEKTLSSLIQKSLFDERTKKYHYEPYLWSINDVLAMLHELLDITWTKGSSDYEDYLKNLRERFVGLAEKYQ